MTLAKLSQHELKLTLGSRQILSLGHPVHSSPDVPPQIEPDTSSARHTSKELLPHDGLEEGRLEGGMDGFFVTALKG